MTPLDRVKEILHLAEDPDCSMREISRITGVGREAVRRIINNPSRYLRKRNGNTEYELLMKQVYDECPICHKLGFLDACENMCITCAARRGGSRFGGAESPDIKVELEGEYKERYEEIRSRVHGVLASQL